MSAVLYLFLAHLGIGIAFSLLFVSREAGLKFFRFNAGMAALLLAAALAFRPAPAPPQAIVNTVSMVLMGTALASLTVYWLTVGRILGWLRPILPPLAAAAGLAAVVSHALSASAATSALTPLPLVLASTLSSMLLLGFTCTAMVLGHWYLVIPSMDVSLLQRTVGWHLGSFALRAVVVAAVLVLAWNTPILSGRSVRGYITSIDGIFFWQRVLFGLAGPAVLGYMTWETAKIRSTQSATGILYIDFFTVIVGEVMANYVLMSTGLAV